MRTIEISNKNNTIVMTQKFAKEAKKFGSDAYKMLQEARRDYPAFRVVVKQSTNKKDSFKGLTFEYMEKYIDRKNPELKEEFLNLIGKSETAKELQIKAASYGEVKNWFLGEFPEINAFLENREKTLNKKAA